MHGEMKRHTFTPEGDTNAFGDRKQRSWEIGGREIWRKEKGKCLLYLLMVVGLSCPSIGGGASSPYLGQVVCLPSPPLGAKTVLS